MKEHPIIFSSEMVRAILDGRKTQTRRIIKAPKLHPDYGYPHWDDAWIDGGENDQYLHIPFSGDAIDRTTHRAYCQYQVGNRLYIKESHKLTRFNLGGERWVRCEYRYEVNDDKAIREFRWKDIPKAQRNRLRKIRTWGKWRSSRFMYNFLARIFLEITNIRVERVQDISKKDAIAEGLKEFFWDDYSAKLPRVAKDIAKGKRWWNHVIIKRGRKSSVWDCPRKAFRELWNDINAKRGYGWDKNSWVWVIEFKISKDAINGKEN